MNGAIQAVNDFPWGIVNFIGLVVLCAVVWRKGWLGQKNEAAIKAQIAKAKQQIAAWEAQLTDKGEQK
jgi:hypothetical protein